MSSHWKVPVQASLGRVVHFFWNLPELAYLFSPEFYSSPETGGTTLWGIFCQPRTWKGLSYWTHCLQWHPDKITEREGLYSTPNLEDILGGFQNAGWDAEILNPILWLAVQAYMYVLYSTTLPILLGWFFSPASATRIEPQIMHCKRLATIDSVGNQWPW